MCSSAAETLNSQLIRIESGDWSEGWAATFWQQKKIVFLEDSEETCLPLENIKSQYYLATKGLLTCHSEYIFL